MIITRWDIVRQESQFIFNLLTFCSRVIESHIVLQESQFIFHLFKFSLQVIESHFAMQASQFMGWRPALGFQPPAFLLILRRLMLLGDHHIHDDEDYP